jgi:hypothetical protein
VHKRISAVKRVEFVSDRMSYIILRGRWCHIIVLNVHAPREDETDDVKDSFYDQIDHILVDRRKHLNVLDVRSFRAADCESDHYLVVAKVRERQAVNKQRSQRCNMDRVKSNIVLRSQIGLQLWKIWTQRWKLIAPGKRIARI